MKKLLFLLPAVFLFAGCSITKEAPIDPVAFDVCLLNGQLSPCDVTGAIVAQHCNSNSCVEVEPIPSAVEILTAVVAEIAEGATSGNMVYAGGIRVEKAPTTGGVIALFPQQPKLLPGNYQDNTKFLIAWAIKNPVTLEIPADAKNVMITVKLHKLSSYVTIPGNIQFSVDGKNYTNGRFVGNGTNTYPIEKIMTQDKPNGADLSSAIGKTLKVQAFIGEYNNFVESVSAEWSF